MPQPDTDEQLRPAIDFFFALDAAEQIAKLSNINEDTPKELLEAVLELAIKEDYNHESYDVAAALLEHPNLFALYPDVVDWLVEQKVKTPNEGASQFTKDVFFKSNKALANLATVLVKREDLSLPQLTAIVCDSEAYSFWKSDGFTEGRYKGLACFEAAFRRMLEQNPALMETAEASKVIHTLYSENSIIKNDEFLRNQHVQKGIVLGFHYDALCASTASDVEKVRAKIEAFVSKDAVCNPETLIRICNLGLDLKWSHDAGINNINNSRWVEFAGMRTVARKTTPLPPEVQVFIAEQRKNLPRVNALSADAGRCVKEALHALGGRDDLYPEAEELLSGGGYTRAEKEEAARDTQQRATAQAERERFNKGQQLGRLGLA